MAPAAATPSDHAIASRGRFRPRPSAILIYFGILLGLELLSEFWWADQPPPVRALMRWSLLVLAVAPVSGLIAWRGVQADQALAAVAERDSIRRLALGLAGEYEPERVPGLLLRQIRELSGARQAFLARPDGEAFRVEVVAGDDVTRLKGQRLPIHDSSPGLAGEALRTRKPVVLSDTWCDAGLAARRELALSDKIRSAAAVPIVIRGEVVGLVGLHADHLGQLNAAHVDLLSLYTEQVAGPFENAMLAASVTRLDAMEHLDKLKSEFLSAVAHELRAPLIPMLGWADLLLNREYSPEEARPMLENIRDGAQHLSVLVGDLLDLSQGEAGRLALELEHLDLAELIEAAVARRREQSPKHQLVAAISKPLPLNADRNRLRQVLDNLLSNAVKYSPPGTRVFITARADPVGQAVVRVSDQGLGLTPDEADRLFAKFYRTESARKCASGTGLGLALCRLILEAHGGAIRAESEGPGLGSAFTFSVPADGPHAQTRAISANFEAIRS